MQVYLIRHGETDWNLEGKCQGISDRPLNETGRRQAEAVARHLREGEFEAFYASSLCRAYETASIIAQGHGQEVQRTDFLWELNQGVFEGCTFPELAGNHGDFLKEWRRSPADLKMPGGESMQELQNRASGELERIVQRHPTGNVVVVGHNLCNVTLLCWAMKMDLNNFRHIRQDVAAINIIEFGGRWAHPVVVKLNDTCHL